MAVPEDLLHGLYTMADLLARCPGMKKEDVYYLEHRGYIHPLKQRHRKVERNFYTGDQVKLVEAIWKYHQAGLSPKDAYQRAVRESSAGQLSLWNPQELELTPPPETGTPSELSETIPARFTRRSAAPKSPVVNMRPQRATSSPKEKPRGRSARRKQK